MICAYPNACKIVKSMRTSSVERGPRIARRLANFPITPNCLKSTKSSTGDSDGGLLLVGVPPHGEKGRALVRCGAAVATGDRFLVNWWVT